jgi:hypothetical protein
MRKGQLELEEVISKEKAEKDAERTEKDKMRLELVSYF